MRPVFSPIEDIIADLKKGKMVVMTDDENRENEGDIVLAGQFATPDRINFIAKHARGLICAPMAAAGIDRLRLFPMGRENADPYKTDWMISVDAARGVTTGISAHDRARTLRLLADPKAGPDDLTRPGHIFPLRAKNGGVLTRAGHTEACVDLLKLAGLKPAGVICEIMNADGTMARMPDLAAFASQFRLRMSTIAALIAYRLKRENFVELVGASTLPVGKTEYEIRVYRDRLTGLEHVALILGDLKQPVLVRVHSECLTGDVFGSRRCDCGPQLKAAMAMIEKEGSGVLLYMRQEGRGIGLGNKIRAYSLQDKGHDTVSANQALGFKADLRDYGTGAQILCDLGVRRMRLLTNNPTKIIGLSGYGLKVAERVPLIITANPHNLKYLRTKRTKMGHLI